MSNLPLPYGIYVLNPDYADQKRGPYTATTEAAAKALACAGVPSGVREQGQDVVLIIAGHSAVYAWVDGVADGDLVLFARKQVISVADRTAMYALTSIISQLVEGETLVYVRDDGAGYSRTYVLKSITSVSGGVFADSAFDPIVNDFLAQLNPGQSPSFQGLSLDNLIVSHDYVAHPSTMPASIGSLGTPDDGSYVPVLELFATNAPDVKKHSVRFKIQSLNTGTADTVDTIIVPNGGTLATTADVSAAVGAGNHYRGKYATLTALQTAIATGNDGDYAIVTGSGVSDQEYIWDGDHSAWALTAVIPAGTFAGLGGSPSDNTALAAALAAKVDIVSGYGLISSSDQTKLNGIAAGATANSSAAQSDVTTGTDNVKFLTSSLWTWIKTQVQTIAGIWTFTNGLISGGTTTVNAASPLLQLQTSSDNAIASISRSTTLNAITYANSILEIGGIGNGLSLNGTNQYLTAVDTGFPTSLTTAAFTISIVVNFTVVSVQKFLWFFGSSTNYLGLEIGGGGQLQLDSNGAHILSGPTGYNDGNWHWVTVALAPNSQKMYIDGTLVGSGTSTNSISLSGTFTVGNNPNGTTVFYQGKLDQLLIYNRTLSPTSGAGSSNEITAIYNGGAGTASPPASALIRRYEFEDGVGSTAIDTNIIGTIYNISLFNSPVWLGAGNAIVPVASSTVTANYITFSDGVNPSEKGQMACGNFQAGRRLQGRTIKHLINTNGVVPYIALYHGFNGKMLLNPTNTTEEPNVASTLDIAGNLAIGASYASTNAAPPNGLINQGRHLSGTSTDNLTDQEQINGHLALVTAGNKIKIATGTNASVGTATLVAGTKTVSTTAVSASSVIFITRNTPGGTVGGLSAPTASIATGTSFVINSDNAADTSTVNWWIIN